MLFYFRKLRQKLFADQKTVSYLKYAFGEIILVVFGILIALQINNLNEDRKHRNTERVLLQEMTANLKADLNDLTFNLEETSTRLRSSEIVFRFLKSDQLFHDTLRPHFSVIFGTTTFTKNTAAYDNLTSVGLDLVADERMRFQITELYTTRYNYVTQLEANVYEFHTEEVLPRLLQHINNDPIFESASPINPRELSQNHEFLEVLKIVIQWRIFMIDIYKDTIQQVRDLIQALDTELEDRLN